MFTQPLDIMNRACQHLGVRQIQIWGENSVTFTELSFAYDKVRRAELQRNVWTFATRRAMLRALTTTSRLLIPATWSATTNYPAGSIVSFADGNGPILLYVALVPGNLNNPPVVKGVPMSSWMPYFGPMAVDQWQPSGATSTTTNILSSGYAVGEHAYIAPGNGFAAVYSSLVMNNQEDPWQVDLWSGSQPYTPGQLVNLSSGGTIYQSLVDLNVGNDPSIVTTASPWIATVTYANGAYVVGSNNIIYKAVTGGNIGHDPTKDNVHWTSTINDTFGNPQTMFAGTWTTTNIGLVQATSNSWLYQAGAQLMPALINYPLNVGPLEQTATLNAFILPFGWLREAPSDPRAGTQAFLGADWSPPMDDWVFENGLLVSSQTVLTVRFVADVLDVSSYDDMFCELLAAQLAIHCWERITNKTGALAMVKAVAKDTIGEARLRNAIEQGPVAETLDLLLACRL